MKLLWSIFAVLGAVFLVVGLAVGAAMASFHATAERTEGRVVSLRRGQDGMAAPDVAYVARDGRERVYRSNTYSTFSYDVGDRVEIAYDPADPDSAGIDGWSERWLLPTIFAGMGGIHFTVGLVGLVRLSRRKREIAWLLRHGQRVDAEVIGVELDRTLRVNRRHPWVIRCRTRLPGDHAERTFTSRRFWYDPTPHIGRTLPVCFDPRDPDRHVVDTGDLRPDVAR